MRESVDERGGWQKALGGDAQGLLLVALFERGIMSGWIGVDLDGTLAVYGEWNGDNIGEPVPAMAARVRAWLIRGVEVRIVTARASVPEMIPAVEAWCERHFGQKLAVTCSKDFGMVEMWDDRCIQVIPNTGQRVDGKEDAIIRTHFVKEKAR